MKKLVIFVLMFVFLAGVSPKRVEAVGFVEWLDCDLYTFVGTIFGVIISDSFNHRGGRGLLRFIVFGVSGGKLGKLLGDMKQYEPRKIDCASECECECGNE
jgi:uncharacterized membrane protein YeaQ/YmgE (transglycosylase-associated protein family)